MVSEGKATEVDHVDFTKALATVFHNILEKLAACDLNRHTLLWVKSKLDGLSVTVNELVIGQVC